MNKYHIRFNTANAGSPKVWRVFENGQENLVEQIDIRVPTWGEQTHENGQSKWNIACQGNMRIVNCTAIIE